MIQVNLEKQGWQVVTAYDGKEGLEKIRAEKPDLCVLDVMMPYMDGFEVLRRLKADRATLDIPVIILSGAQGANDKVTAFDLGSIDYVCKPFDISEMRARLRSAKMARSTAGGFAGKSRVKNVRSAEGAGGKWATVSQCQRGL